MRRFKVWLDKGVVGLEPEYDIVEVPDSYSEEECDAACRDALDVLIENTLDSGWRELEPGEQV